MSKRIDGTNGFRSGKAAWRAMAGLLLAAAMWAGGRVEAHMGESGVPDTASPFLLPDPVSLHDGSVTEVATDIDLPGPTLGWRHTRTYSSALTMTNGQFIQGEKWMVKRLLKYLRQGPSDSVELFVDHLHKRVFTRSDSAPDYTWTGPSDFPATLTQDAGAKMFTLTMTRTGEEWYFNNFDSSLSDQKGFPLGYTDRYGSVSVSFTITSPVTYARITSVSVGSWNVVYEYHTSGTNAGKIEQIDAKVGNKYLQRVKYTYFGDQGYPSDVGSAGDLIMVEVFRKATDDTPTDSDDIDFSIKRVTQYRYYTGAQDHKLKMVFSPAMVEQAVAAPAGATEPEDLLELDDDAVVAPNEPTMETYANVKYTYYTTDFLTTDVDTDEGGVGGNDEDLEGDFAGSGKNVDETGLVASQTVYKDYKGYLGTRTFFYMANHAVGTDLNEVTRIVAVDHTESGTRRIYGFSKDRQLLREVFIDDPSGSPKYWCTSYIRGSTKDENTNDVNKIIKKRMPSAHACINDDSEVETFLDATADGADWTTTIMHDGLGLVYVYDYNKNAYLTDVKIKKGKSGTEYYLWAADYGTGGDDEPEYLPLHVYVYPDRQTSARGDASRLDTTYSYDFHNTDAKLMVRKIEYPEVDDSTQNGPGSSHKATFWEYYDDYGRLRWTKDAEGRVNYYAYNELTGGIGYVMVDVETDDPPTDITSGSSPEWTDWDGDPPFAQEGDALELVTKVLYDDDGRWRQVADPLGFRTATAYQDNEVRVYPGWTDSAATLPIRVTKVNDDYLAEQVYTLDPGGVTAGADNNLPTGVDSGEAKADYVTWTKYSYDGLDSGESTAAGHTALLEQVDRYHDIPASGDELSTHFYRTFCRYDNQGRRTRVIQVVSGTTTAAGVEQVTAYEYDELGRVTEVHRAVSSATQDMGSDYSSETGLTLKKVRHSFYDESTPGTHPGGVGDGHVTSTVFYYDTPDTTVPIDYDTNGVETTYHYNWRGQLRGVRPEEPPCAVLDVDNLNRTVAVAEYQEVPTWSTVLANDDYALTGDASDRRSLTRTLYDDMGRVYRTETFAVEQDGVNEGDTGDKLMTDTYYDRNSRVVARKTAGSPRIETAYDGAGRVIQQRTVKVLQGEGASYYSGAAFDYCLPDPTAWTGGDEGVLTVARYDYDKVGNVKAEVTMEANHLKTDGSTANDDGLSLTETNSKYDYVQTVVYRWYDDAHRLETVDVCGTRVTSGTGWTYGSAVSLTRPAEPTHSETDYGGGYVSGVVTKYVYEDESGRLEEVKVTDPVTGNTHIKTVYTQDDLGRTTKVEEADTENEERTTITVYDGLSNVTKLILDMENDGIDGDEQITEYIYGDPNDASLVTVIKYPDWADADDQIDLAYALDGRLKEKQLQKLGAASRTKIAYVYDAVRRLQAENVTVDGGVDTTVLAISRAYDVLGRVQYVTSHSDADPDTSGFSDAVNQIKYTYDDFGRLITEEQEHYRNVDGSTLSVQYAYAPGSGGVLTDGPRLTKVTYPNLRELNYDYGSGINDKISRPASLKDNDGTTVLASYSYNGVGRMVVEDYAGPSGSDPDVRLDYYDDYSASPVAGTYEGLDRYGRVTMQLWRDHAAGQDREEFLYGYDEATNRTWKEHTVTSDKDEFYTYDKLNRLKKAERGTLSGSPYDTIDSKKREENYTLDSGGNWTTYYTKADTGGGLNDEWKHDRDHNDANELADTEVDGDIIETDASGGATDWVDPAYNEHGNMTSGPKGDSVTTKLHFKYDAWGRLVEVWSDSGGDPGSRLAQYRYDGLHGRIRKMTPDSGDDWDVEEYYYNAAWQLLEVRTGTADRGGGGLPEPDTVSTLSEQYVWSLRYIDAPVLRDRDVAGGGDLGKPSSGLDERLYYLTDANMNVTTLVNASGDAQERVMYDPYGRPTFMDGSWTEAGCSGKANRILFAGYFFDEESGLYHVRNRMYHPTLGRWMQRDPLGYVDGLNLYQYVGGSPIGAYDPYGLWYTGVRVAWRITNYHKNGQRGTYTKYYEIWGRWHQPEWMARGEGQWREWTGFVPDPVQPSVTENRKPARAVGEDLYYTSGSGAQEFLEKTPSALGINVGGAAVGALGGRLGLNLHLDIDNPDNTGLYGVAGGSSGVDLGVSAGGYVAWGTRGSAWGGDFEEAEVNVGPVQVTVFTNNDGIDGIAVGLTWGSPGGACVSECYYQPLIGGQKRPRAVPKPADSSTGISLECEK